MFATQHDISSSQTRFMARAHLLIIFESTRCDEKWDFFPPRASQRLAKSGALFAQDIFSRGFEASYRQRTKAFEGMTTAKKALGLDSCERTKSDHFPKIGFAVHISSPFLKHCCRNVVWSLSLKCCSKYEISLFVQPYENRKDYEKNELAIISATS